jgi:hypothetical protein
MPGPLPGQTTSSSEAFTRFLSDAKASARSLQSPSGKVLGRQFTFRAETLAAATAYSIPERHRLVDQLRLALVDYYVHLERKKSIYGFDPVRALDLLKPTIETICDAEFQQAIVDVIVRTRDRHLFFYGRAPIGMSAVLPFMVEQCWDDQGAHYVVTHIDANYTPKQLSVGAFVTHWNGIPIERFIRLNANVFDGGNEAASLARSIAFLTSRDLRRFATPLEDWVDLRFTLERVAYEERFFWEGFDATQTPTTPSIGRNLTGFGGDPQLLQLQHARRVRFAPRSFDMPPAPPPAPGRPGIPQILGRHTTTVNGTEVDVFDYGSVTTEYGTFAYVRLWNFEANDADEIVNAFIGASDQMPRNGLVIDMRDNSGGYIAAGEHVLQLFTPRRFTPTRFQFRVTAATQAMVTSTDQFQAWVRSFSEAVETGEPYSQGYPIEGTDEDFNQIGQRYFGPVVLISNALAFSTADMFAAGFSDHEIGRVICTDNNMAAAGGNNWYPWDVVRLYNPDFGLDLALKATLETGVLSPEIREAFNRDGTSLSQDAILSDGQTQYGGTAWTITDGALTHVVRYLPWMSDPLRAYLYQGRSGLADMPTGVVLSVTMRRAVRVGINEGQLIEDLGIRPDIVYQMTLQDVTQQNQDLMTRATLELSQMSAYDLEVKVNPEPNGFTLTCRTLNLTSLEVFAGHKYLVGVPASDSSPAQLTLSTGFAKVEVRGFKDDTLVARRVIALTGP